MLKLCFIVFGCAITTAGKGINVITFKRGIAVSFEHCRNYTGTSTALFDCLFICKLRHGQHWSGNPTNFLLEAPFKVRFAVKENLELLGKHYPTPSMPSTPPSSHLPLLQLNIISTKFALSLLNIITLLLGTLLLLNLNVGAFLSHG